MTAILLENKRKKKVPTRLPGIILHAGISNLLSVAHANYADTNFSVETNFISPAVIVRLMKSLLTTQSIEEFRASNQVSNVCAVMVL